LKVTRRSREIPHHLLRLVVNQARNRMKQAAGKDKALVDYRQTKRSLVAEHRDLYLVRLFALISRTPCTHAKWQERDISDILY
jgi:hypothetical protein